MCEHRFIPVCVIGRDLYLLSIGIVIGVGCSAQCLSGCLETKVHPASTVTNKPFLQHTQFLHMGLWGLELMASRLQDKS